MSQRTGSSRVDRPLPPGTQHREAVVLRGDLDPTGLEVLHRVVRAAVAEGQLEGLEPDRPAEQLVAEADAPDRHLADHAAHVLDDVVERRRVAGAVREEDRVRLAREQLLGGRRARMQLQVHAPLAQVAHDRVLDARCRSRSPADRRPRGSPARAGVTSRARSRPVIDGSARTRSRSPRASAHASAANTPPRIAPLSRMWRTSARVSTPDSAGMPQSAQPGEPAALGVGRVLAVDALAHDHRARVDPVRLHVRRRHAVVPDQRVGEDDDLAGVARVGDRLLVAGHRGVEDDLAGARPRARRPTRRRSGCRPRAAGRRRVMRRRPARSCARGRPPRRRRSSSARGR